MKKLFFNITLLILALQAWSQYTPKNVVWQQTYGERKMEEAYSLVATPDGGYALAGYTESKGVGEKDMLIVKTDKNGKVEWERLFGTKFDDVATDIAIHPNGNIIVIGNTIQMSDYGNLMILEYDMEGKSVYQNMFGGKKDDRAYSVITTPDKKIVIAGYTDSQGSGRRDMWILEFDEEWNIQWEKTYGGKKDDAAKDICYVPEDKEYIVAGYTESKGEGNRDLWMLKFDQRWNIKLDRTFGTTNDDEPNFVIPTADGGYLMGGQLFVGYKSDGLSYQDNLWLLKMDKNLQDQWDRKLGSYGTEAVHAAINTADRGYTVAGFTDSKGEGRDDVYLLRIGEYGNIEWEKTYGGKKDERAYDIIPTKDGAYLIAGYTKTFGEGRFDMFLFKAKDDVELEEDKKLAFTPEEKKLKEEDMLIVAQSPKHFVSFDFRKANINYYPTVEETVNKQLEAWSKKGIYESTDDFVKKMSLKNAIKQDAKFTEIALNKYAPKQIKLDNVKIKGTYDANNELFTLDIPSTENIVVQVPLTEAPDFEANWNSHRFMNVKYGIYNDKFVIANATILLNGKQYNFDAKQTAPYSDEMRLTINTYDEKQMRVAKVYTEIINSVKDSMELWEKKGEFELPQDFAKRTSSENRLKQEEIFTQKVLQYYAPKVIELDSIADIKYIATKQKFTIPIPGSEPMYLPVPLDSGARQFKANWDTYQFRNVNYGIYDYQYVVLSADVAVNDTLVFHYDAVNDAEYGKQIQSAIHLDEVDYGMLDRYTYASIFPEGEKQKVPPNLIITNLNFSDFNENNQIDANEETKISFSLINQGEGKAYRLRMKVFELNGVADLKFENSRELGDLPAGEKMDIDIPITGGMELADGRAKFRIRITEANRNNPDDNELALVTNSFVPPKVEVISHTFTKQNGGNIELDKKVNLRLRIKNTGKGTAKDITVKFMNPSDKILAAQTEFTFDVLLPGETQKIDYQFTPSNLFSGSEIPISVLITESYGKYGAAPTLRVSMNEDLEPYTPYDLVADVDFNIPKADTVCADRYAIIIGNEDYTSFQEGLDQESDVEFAAADAITFRKYAMNVFGIPKENIGFKINARKHEMNKIIEEIIQLAQTTSGGRAEIVLFYAGHGFPDEQTSEAYIMPVDVAGADVKNGIKLSDLYKKLTQAQNIERVTVFIDACFSGGGRQEGLLAARAVKIKPKETPDLLTGNFVAFSASSGEQTALPYKDKNHGMFTYALLKKLKETQGDISYGYLADYIEQYVKNKSQRVNGKDQTPKVNVSQNASETWKDWKIIR